MTTGPKQIFIQTLLFFIVATVGLIVIDQTTEWNLTVKIIWPIAWSAAGLIFALYQLHRRNSPPKAKSNAPARGTKNETPAQRAHPLIQYIIWLVLLGLFIGGLSWIAKLFQANVDRATGKYSNPAAVPTAHVPSRCGERADKSHRQCLHPGKIYDYFPITANQCWRAYITRDIEYRVKVTGNEPFIPVPRLYDYKTTVQPDKTGTLQIKTAAKDLCLGIDRHQLY